RHQIAGAVRCARRGSRNPRTPFPPSFHPVRLMPTIFARFCRAALCTLALAGSSACSDNSISDPQLDPEASGENRTVANALTVNITDVQTASGYRYVVATGLADSVEAYIDRPWVYDNVPRFLQGATY